MNEIWSVGDQLAARDSLEHASFAIPFAMPIFDIEVDGR